VNRQTLENTLKAVVALGGGINHCIGNNMWLTVVSADLEVCEVVFSGADRFDQWRLSRVISAQKANTAASLCSSTFAFSSANLFQTVQTDQFLFGLQQSNPVDPAVAYRGRPEDFGTHHDPMKGEMVGGVNVFGGGLCLYDSKARLLGGLGVSGDTSCGDHFVAWRVRHNMTWDYVPAGPNGADDNIIFSDHPSTDPTGSFTHPLCPFLGVTTATAANNLRSEFPAVRIASV